ncbi:hypothetical protein QQS21_002528 [Conoideocrella luteorostrata]|uniref:Glycoside hydrolase family 16 protein n=1 Tax=Conoideocrella luteorostrata TaxID=1105319 RepID=A0AAJ0CZ53_9HYPO|nr:hypothetical protein QQS21_002528 [Conoideocrella luteorostrata]
MAYALATSYAGEALLSGFNWFDGADPTHGFVSYQSRPNAEAKGLYSVDEKTGVVRLGVDSTNTYSLNEGRPSIRLESKEAFNHGLFIADFLHMPPSQCGLWPAFWSYGPNWPFGGEVDIIEGANDQYHNILSAHTAPGCTLSSEPKSQAWSRSQSQSQSQTQFSGVQRSANCDVGTDNVGCGYKSPADEASAYGDGFNAAKGGVYAMEWDSDFIKIWHFARVNIPRDITNKQPTPKDWGTPDAVFGGSGCDVDKFFKDMSLVININFCGDWGNAIWGKTDGCGNYAPTCSEYVAKNPQAFSNAYWDVKYIEAYQKPSATESAGESSTHHTTMTTSLTTTVTMNGHKTTKVIGYNTTIAPAAAHSPVKSKHTPSAHVTSSSSIRPKETSPPPRNAIKIDQSALLGCFGSSDGFKTFKMVKDSKDMTAERCVKLCRRSMFAGVYDSRCYCADSLDANTRASDEKTGVCDHPCPGDDAQYCGGLARDLDDLATANTTASPAKHLSPQDASSSPTTSPEPAPAPADFKPAPKGLLHHFSNITQRTDSQVAKNTRRSYDRRDARPKNMLFTVYGAVKNDIAKPPPPPMAPGQNITYIYTFTQRVVETHVKTVIPVEHTASPQKGKAKFVMHQRPVRPAGNSTHTVLEKTVVKTVHPTEVVIEECGCESAEQTAAPPAPTAAAKTGPIPPPPSAESSARIPQPPTQPIVPIPPVVTAGAGGTWHETKWSAALGLATLAIALLL